MAMKKCVRAANGVETNYHRVALVVIEPGAQTTILVHSYLNEDGRQWEKDRAAGLNREENPSFPYVDYEYHHIEPDLEMTVEKAYEYLKTLPEFENAEDC